MHASQDPHHRAPSPTRRSMFDFVSPFDALTGSSPGAKKKPAVPVQQQSHQLDDWASLGDPKRKSVENLMDQLTRGQVPPPPPQSQPLQPVVLPYEPVYPPAEEPSYREEPAQVRSRPLPPQPVIHPGTASPRSSPPKQASQPARQPRRAGESPIVPGGSQGPFGSSYNRDKESSPLPQRGGAEPKRNGSKGKNASPPCVSSLFKRLA